jgi:hypothetical protein
MKVFPCFQLGFIGFDKVVKLLRSNCILTVMNILTKYYFINLIQYQILISSMLSMWHNLLKLDGIEDKEQQQQ